MIINLINPNLAKIILIFAASPGRKWQRKEIKEMTGMNNVPLDNSLNELLTHKLINESKRIYSLNFENSIVQQTVKEIKEKISNLPFKIQFILVDFINSISKIKDAEKIILFGSYSKLVFNEKSDVDLAIVLKERSNLHEKKISLLTEKLSKRHKIDIQEHFFTESDLKHKEDPLIKDILRNGIEFI